MTLRLCLQATLSGARCTPPGRVGWRTQHPAAAANQAVELFHFSEYVGQKTKSVELRRIQFEQHYRQGVLRNLSHRSWHGH